MRNHRCMPPTTGPDATIPGDGPVTVLHANETGVRLAIRDGWITVTLNDPQTGPRDVNVIEVAISYTAVSGPHGPVCQPERIVYLLDDRDHPWAFASDEAFRRPEEWPAGVRELVDAYRPVPLKPSP